MNSSKIAILSMQRVKNYGSVLQAYSLKKIIEEIVGGNVDFIDPQYDDYYIANMPVIDSDDYEAIEEYRIGKLLHFFRKVRNHFVNNKFESEIKKFQNNYLNLSSESTSNHYDVVVEGSDEVFKCTRKIYRDLYGANFNGDKIITYAASAGSACIEGISGELISKVKSDVNRFSAMSVRDFNTFEYISKLYDGPIEMHLDPVLMGRLSEIEHKKVKKNNYILVYAYANRIRSKEEVDAIKRFARKKKLETIAIGAPQIWCDSFIAPSPFEVLDYFANANYVITDTFHGTIFSVINRVKFVSIIRKTNRNKMTALLEQLGLMDRILEDISDLERIIEQEIDYTIVFEYINEQRQKTWQYLKRQLIVGE